jgi:pimeloyl-CoA dehydrogenase small subunit
MWAPVSIDENWGTLMDFSFSDEQTLLQDSIERFIQNDYPFDARQKAIKQEPGFNPALWAQFAELGWLGVPFSEADGGFGGSALDTMIVMEQFGKGLVVEPFLATVVLAGGALKVAGNQAQKDTYLTGIVDGSSQAALAFVEPQGRYNLADLTTTAQSSGDGWVLNGYKAVVLNGPSADFFVVSARTSGEQRDRAGVSLFLVAADAEGLSRRDYPTVDAFRASEVSFDNVQLGADALLGQAGEGFAALEQVIDEGILAVGAEAVGAMEVLYKDTVEYCKVREQFGQPIGKFQVLQHRMVDMFMEHEQSKSLVFMAAMRMDEGYGEEARKAASALKVQVGKSGRFVGQGAVQLHGGMGMTDELAVGHHLKRLLVLNTLFGDSEHHLRQYALASA